MMKKITKQQWYDDTLEDGKAKSPAIAPNSEKHLEGLNRGEIHINDNSEDPTIFITNNKGEIVGFKPLSEIDIEALSNIFLSKTRPDQTEHLLELLGGIAFHDGYGITPDGEATLKGIKADYLKVIEIINEKLSHVGGSIILSPARMKCIRVEELQDAYRCYFDRGKLNDAGRYETDQQFKSDDQARCQVFTGNKQKYYWRLVTTIGDDYIDLSKTDFDEGSDIPVEGDDIIQLGNRTDIDRQNAQILSSFGLIPSFKQYVGINSYSLDEKEETRLSPGDNELSGVLHIQNGSTGAGNLQDLPDEIQKATDLGSVNLLRNSGFTGQYTNEELTPDTVLSPDTELYNKKLANWTGIATVNESTKAVSGYAVTLGSLSQTIKLIVGENYVVSYKASGTSVAVSCGNYSVAQALTATQTRYVHKFKFSGNQLFLVSGTAVLCDLKLERGTIATDWTPSPLDNDKSMAEMQALSYIERAIKEGSMDMLGGLALMNMLLLGNYRDGKMQQVTAGVSGVYNDDDDVAYWAGGSFEQAIRTVMFYKDNPTATPTEEEFKMMANYAVTHGGRSILNDVIVRGYVYALGGFFKGRVEADSGVFRGDIYADKGVFKGGVQSTPELIELNAAQPSYSLNIDPSKNMSYNVVVLDVGDDLPTYDYILELPGINEFIGIDLDINFQVISSRASSFNLFIKPIVNMYSRTPFIFWKNKSTARVVMKDNCILRLKAIPRYGSAYIPGKPNTARPLEDAVCDWAVINSADYNGSESGVSPVGY